MDHECTSNLNDGDGLEYPFIALLFDEDFHRLRMRARRQCDDRQRHWSRSYSGHHALIAGWHDRVGADIEVLDHSLESTWTLHDVNFRSTMMTPEERQLELSLDDDAARKEAVSLWCSKEALAKALGTPLEWDPSRLRGPALWPSHAYGRWRATFLDADSLGSHALAWVVYDIGS